MDASVERVEQRMPAILLVDGEVGTRAPMAERLRAARYQVLEAATADEALALLNSRLDIDALVALDAVSGPMDGLALADWVRKTRPALDVVVVPAVMDPDALIALLPPATPAK